MLVSGSPYSTQVTYIRAIRDLMEDCGSIPEDLSAERIKAHLSSLRPRLSSSPLNLRVCGIKYYFRHVVKRLDLVVDIPNPRVAKYVQEVLSERDLGILFGACRSMRELAMLHLLYDCGLRSREVCYLKLSDFDKIHRKITLRNSTGGDKKQMPLKTAEFIRRFAQHILPLKFRRIRHYGFLSNAAKTKSLELARQSLKVPQSKADG